MLSKKSRNNPILMEAYHVLLGYVELDRDGKIIPMDGPTGITAPADGAGRIRNFGITHVKKRYISGKSNKQVMFEAKKAFKNLGRGIYFFSQEDVYGCQLKSYVFYPVVLAFYENEDGQLQLSAFTARCLTARLAARIAIRQFEKVTGNFLTRDEKEKEETGRAIRSPIGMKRKRRHAPVSRLKRLRTGSSANRLRRMKESALPRWKRNGGSRKRIRRTGGRCHAKTR